METIKNPPVKTPKKFDATKNYVWEPTDEFILTGEQFAMLYKVAKETAFSRTGANAVEKVAVYELLQEILERGVEQGVITEQQIEQKPLKTTEQ